MQLTLRAGGWDEMTSWIMSFGRRAKVLKPEQMREEIRKYLEEMRERYARDKG